MLEGLFAKHADVIKNPYEAVRTVGFEAKSKTSTGEIQLYRFRVEIVRFLDSSGFQPIVWSAIADSTKLGGMVWQVAFYPQLLRVDPDAALEALLEQVALHSQSLSAAPIK